MSYRKKLIALYSVIIIIPMLVFGLSALSMNRGVMSEVKDRFRFFEGSDNSSNHRYIRDYKISIAEYPGLALNKDYNDLLFDVYPDLVDSTITLDNKIIYQHSVVSEDNTEIFQQTHEVETDLGLITISFKYHQGDISDSIFKKIFVDRLLISFIVYLLLHAVFLYVLFKNTLPDTIKLTEVANKISEGNYDFEVDVSRDDEIGDVYKAFDNMRESLKIYENNRKDLITNISHDLKTPIATIKGYVTGINDGLASTPEKLDKYLNIIYNNTIHLDELINDLFLYSKLDVDQADFDFKPLHFDKFIDYYIDELKLDLEEKNIVVNWKMPDLNQNTILADGFRLKQVLNNIVSNAQKYFDKDTKVITFNLHHTNQNLVLDISDNGKGINEEQLNHIFERFYRGDASRNTNMGSSGLGLAIVKQILDKHNGTISASSHVGESTTITITLPLEGA